MQARDDTTQEVSSVPEQSSIRPYHHYLEEQSRDGSLRKGERTRLRLLAATSRFLQDRFFHDMRIADICASAEVSQGTFYLYFEDKSVVTTDLLTAFSSYIYETLDQSRRQAVTAQDAIYLPTLTYVDIYRENRGLMRCLTLLSEESAEFEAIFRDLSASWNQRIARGVQTRLGKSDAALPECVAMAYALASMVDEFLAKIYVRKDPSLAFMADDPEAIATMLSDIWERSLSPR